MVDLLGPLGLPGAVLALFGVFLLGLKIKKELGGNGRLSGGYTFQQASALTQGVERRVETAERAIQQNVNDTRHSINNGVEKAIGRIEESNERNTERLLEKLGSIEDALNRRPL